VKRITTTILLTAAAMSGAGLVAPSPASAATSCYGSSCTGLDPSATTCQNDAETVEGPGGIPGNIAIELRYSPSCRAAWARLKNATSSNHITVENTNGNTYSASGTGTIFTRMVNDKGIESWACGYASFGYECTNAY
jgi:hypothetical protein